MLLESAGEGVSQGQGFSGGGKGLVVQAIKNISMAPGWRYIRYFYKVL